MFEAQGTQQVEAAYAEDHHIANGGTRQHAAGPSPMLAPAPRRPVARMLLLIGALVVAGLAITLVVIRTHAPAHEAGPPSAEFAVGPVRAAHDAAPAGIAGVEGGGAAEAKPADASAARKAKGPMGTVTVPSAGLRSGPSLDAKMTKAVVKGRERVAVLQRRSSSSGPDWIEIETASGRRGWVWASVVKQGKKAVQ